MKSTPLRFALSAWIFSCAASPLPADVIWRGTGSVTSNTAAFIQAPVGSAISWSMEFGEAGPAADPGDHALPLSIRFTTVASETFRIDSEHADFDVRNREPGGLDLVNWSLAETDELSHVQFPAQATRTVLTMRLTGDDAIGAATYQALRNPSFAGLDAFFGHLDAGQGTLWFAVDSASIRISERVPQPSPGLAVIPGVQAQLEWPVPSAGRFRLEESADLRTWFTADEAECAGPVATFTDAWSLEGRAFYRLFRLDMVFVSPPKPKAR